MRVGFGLPQIGPLGTRENLVKVAQRAEELGYDNLWTIERLLYPLKPQTPYPATADGSLPEPYKLSLDPLTALTYVAAHTKKIGLGTSVLDIPYYNPVVLARQLTAIDVLSEGRLRVGFGLGWSKDEFDAAGASLKRRGARASEFLKVLRAIWTSDPVEFQGTYFTIPKSIIQPKPVQKPHPPIYMAAFAPAALKRAAELSNGWNPVALPVAAMDAMSRQMREMARAAGRDPSRLEVVVRANVEFWDKPRPKEGFIYTGTAEQIQEDINATKALGVTEIFFDPVFSADGSSIDRYLRRMEQLRGMV
ncbi:MAG TPA: LLM class F420-dependent oxidoreductase [Terriglobia bacterium]|nr:LLM class F420-dependent oxidoreductase [Terriglobia bacterium]